MNRTLNGALVRVLAFVLALYPLLGGEAAAQTPAPGGAVADRPLSEYEPFGLRLGAVHAFPALEIDAATTDNLFAEENNEQSDTITTVRALLPMRMTWSRHALSAGFGVEQTFHQDFAENDTTTGFAGIAGRLDVGSDAEITAAARYAREAEPRYEPNSPLGALEPIQYDETRLNFGAARRFNRLRLSGGLARVSYDFDDADSLLGPIEQDDRDRDETTATLRGEWEISPGISLVGQASANNREYDLAPPAVSMSRDSSGATFLAGAAFDITNLVRGQVTAGYFMQDYDDPASGEVNGLALSTSVQYFVTQLTTLTFTADRSVEEATYANAASYVSLRGGVQVRHELRRNIILNGGLWTGRREFTALDREDDVWTMEAGAAYRLNRRVALEAAYRRDVQESAGLQADRDFEINGLRLRLRLTL